MNTNEHHLRALITRGEGVDCEFKTGRDQLPKSAYETVCAFLNRYGGALLLGMADDGSVTGIDPNALESIRKDFVTAINNPRKLTPPTYLSINTAELDGKTLLHIYVPESSQVHRCNGRIYDRNEDADLDITDHTVQACLLQAGGPPLSTQAGHLQRESDLSFYPARQPACGSDRPMPPIHSAQP